MKKNTVDSVLEIYLVLPMYEHSLHYFTGNADFLDSSDGKESLCNAGDASSIPGLRRDRLPTPVFWPGEFHGLYSPCGWKELDTTESLSFIHSLTVPGSKEIDYK